MKDRFEDSLNEVIKEFSADYGEDGGFMGDTFNEASLELFIRDMKNSGKRISIKPNHITFNIQGDSPVMLLFEVDLVIKKIRDARNINCIDDVNAGIDKLIEMFGLDEDNGDAE